jgi:hypothetical protein
VDRHPQAHLPSLWVGMTVGVLLGLAIAWPAHSAQPVATLPQPSFQFYPVTPLYSPQPSLVLVDLSSPSLTHYSPKPSPALIVHRQVKPVIKVAQEVATSTVATSYSDSVADARLYARSRIGSYQFRCLDALWSYEDHWNPLALNQTSGAYGIPQALPASKMASAGSDWSTSPLTQVKWGLGYISGRYGSACTALAHWNMTGWY